MKKSAWILVVAVMAPLAPLACGGGTTNATSTGASGTTSSTSTGAGGATTGTTTTAGAGGATTGTTTTGAGGTTGAGMLDAGTLDAGSLGAPHSILLTTGVELRIYDLDGNLLQTLPVPAAHRETGEGLRGVAEDASGRVHIFAGTFNPRLATWDGNAWSSRPIPGTANVVHYGHVAAVGNLVLCTGMNIAFTRYDASAQITDTIAGGEYTDVIRGADGKLYAVNAFDQTVEIDPTTLAAVSTLPISPSPDLIAADAAGVMHGAWTQNGTLFTFPPGGAAISGPSLGIMDFQDIDIATDGTFIFCGGGKLVIGHLGAPQLVTKTFPYSTAFCSFGYATK